MVKFQEIVVDLLREHNGDTEMVAEIVTNSMNEAIAEYEATYRKQADAEALVNMYNDFMNKYYPGDKESDLRADEFINLLELIEKMLNLDTEDFFNLLLPKGKEIGKDNCGGSLGAIKDWLKENNL